MGLDVCWCSRANYILEFKDKTEFQGKIKAAARFLTYYHFELVKWFGIPMKGDARFSPGDEKKFHDLRLQKYASIEA
jgi:hypothetical protein